jgi:hypothetical protein
MLHLTSPFSTSATFKTQMIRTLRSQGRCLPAAQLQLVAGISLAATIGLPQAQMLSRHATRTQATHPDAARAQGFPACGLQCSWAQGGAPGRRTARRSRTRHQAPPNSWSWYAPQRGSTTSAERARIDIASCACTEGADASSEASRISTCRRLEENLISDLEPCSAILVELCTHARKS